MKIKIVVDDAIVKGKQVSFKAPCSSAEATGLIINDVEYDIVDAMGSSVLSIENVWDYDSIVSVILNTNTNKAYIQNPHNNSLCVVGFKMSSHKKVALEQNIFNSDIFSIVYNSDSSKFDRHCNFASDLNRLKKSPMVLSGYVKVKLEFTPTDSVNEDTIENHTLFVVVNSGIDDGYIKSFETDWKDAGVVKQGDKVIALFEIGFDSSTILGEGVLNLKLRSTDWELEDLINEGSASITLVKESQVILQIL